MNEEQNHGTGSVPPAAAEPAATYEEPVAGDSPAGGIADKVAGCTGRVDACFDKALGLVENHPWETWLNAANGFIGKFLPLIVGVAGFFAFATGLITAIRYDARFSVVVSTVGLLVATLFAMNLAPKALALTRSFLEKREPDAMRPELLRILEVLLGLGGLVLAVGMLLQFTGESLVDALVLAAISLLMIIVFSHPALIGVKADYPTNVVEEWIAILLLPLKIVLSLLTLVTGIVTVVLFVTGIVQLFDNGFEAMSTLVEAALAPLVVPLGAYLLYLATVFLLDLYRAVVSLPRKLDDLCRAVESK